MTTVESLMQAVLVAGEEQKEAALKVLRRETTETPTRSVTGPLLMRMGDGAKFLGVSRCTLWRVFRAGTIKKVELYPRSSWVRREDLIALSEGKLEVSLEKSRKGRPRGRPSTKDKHNGDQEQTGHQIRERLDHDDD